MSASFTNQTIAQIELFTRTDDVSDRRARAAEAPRREGRAAPRRRARRQAHRAAPRAGRVHRRARRGAVQARPLPPSSSVSSQLRQRFAQLHAVGTFVIPNPWDVGSARLLESLGFPAIATTSSGFAASLGRADQQVTLDELLAHVVTLVDAVGVPLSVDAERLLRRHARGRRGDDPADRRHRCRGALDRGLRPGARSHRPAAGGGRPRGGRRLGGCRDRSDPDGPCREPPLRRGRSRRHDRAAGRLSRRGRARRVRARTRRARRDRARRPRGRRAGQRAGAARRRRPCTSSQRSGSGACRQAARWRLPPTARWCEPGASCSSTGRPATSRERSRPGCGAPRSEPADRAFRPRLRAGARSRRGRA